MNPSSKNGEQVLTSREREILRRIVNGKSNRQIGAELNLSVNTVQVHRANIMARSVFTRARNWLYTRYGSGWSRLLSTGSGNNQPFLGTEFVYETASEHAVG